MEAGGGGSWDALGLLLPLNLVLAKASLGMQHKPFCVHPGPEEATTNCG